MQRIPAKERFSKNTKSLSYPPGILDAAILSFGMNPSECKIEKLSGGFMNANYLVQNTQQKVVLRIYSTNMTTAQREFDILQFLQSHPVKAPKPLAILEIEKLPVVFMEYLEGITLEDKILSGEPIDSDIYKEIGVQLGLIHGIRFEDAGFIAPGVKPGKEYGDFGLFIRQFIERTMEALKTREDRLDLQSNQRVVRLVQDKWDLVLRSPAAKQLVHTDFNPKNIMVTKGAKTQLVGIIDWEFCLSGEGLIDIGNFFRFAYDYPEEAANKFAEGYKQSGGELSDQWMDVVKLLDLGNMCSFFERPEDYQESFRTARIVTKSYLEHFGY